MPKGPNPDFSFISTLKSLSETDGLTGSSFERLPRKCQLLTFKQVTVIFQILALSGVLSSTEEFQGRVYVLL